MLNTPFAPWPSFSRDEIEAASRVLASNRVNYWTGTEGRQFEDEFARWCGASRAVALANGTLALELALRALGIGAGDEVIVTPRSFMASASCVVVTGATPVFADVDADSQNITAETIARVVTPRTRAVICVHLAGWPCEMDEINALARERGLAVIEDCAQAHGARYRSRPVGNLGDVAAWSFCQDKIMTTAGEGGMLTTDREDLWSYAWSFKDHGKSWQAAIARQTQPGFRWLHESFGSNYRITEVQATIGRLQLTKLPEWQARRAANAEAILDACRETGGLRVPRPPSHVEHAWYKCYVFARPEALSPGWSRDRVVTEINARGVPCYTGSCSEIYLEKAFEGTAWRPAQRLPVARSLGETSLMFLVHPTLREEEIAKTCSAIRDVMSLACGR